MYDVPPVTEFHDTFSCDELTPVTASPVGTAVTSRIRVIATAHADAPEVFDVAVYVTAPLTEPDVTVHVPRYIAPSLPVVVVFTACQVMPPCAQPVIVSTCVLCVIASSFRTTAIISTSPLAIDPAVGVAVADTVTSVSSVSVSTIDPAEYAPDVVPRRAVRAIVGEPEVTENVAVPVPVAVARLTKAVARTEPVLTPVATDPDVFDAWFVKDVSVVVGVEPNGLLPIIATIASSTDPAIQSGTEDVVPKVAVP